MTATDNNDLPRTAAWTGCGADAPAPGAPAADDVEQAPSAEPCCTQHRKDDNADAGCCLPEAAR